MTKHGSDQSGKRSRAAMRASHGTPCVDVSVPSEFRATLVYTRGHGCDRIVFLGIRWFSVRWQRRRRRMTLKRNGCAARRLGLSHVSRRRAKRSDFDADPL